MNSLEWYFLLYLLIIFIVDYTTFFVDVPILKKMLIKHPVLMHPCVCSLCATWWMTVIFVLCSDVSPWVLLMPFGSSIVSVIIGKIMDLANRLLDRI